MLFFLFLIYLLVGCIRTAILIVDQSSAQEEPMSLSAMEVGTNVLLWGVVVPTFAIVELILNFMGRFDD